jgi:hypothetical protein
VRTDDHRLGEVAEALRAEAHASALTFSAPPFLPADHPHALSMLWIATLHQYGFWDASDHGWVGPMYASLDGVRYKGSDFIWAAFSRAARTDPSMLSASRMANEPSLFAQVCTADDGRCPVPDLESHLSLHQAHGHQMTTSASYEELLLAANQSDQPGAALLQMLSQQPGYGEDPLQKKASLLLVILANRPEGMLDLRDPQSVVPIVDYHIMRGCLRTGCVEILDPDLRRRLEERRWVDDGEEDEIRRAAYESIEALVARSGRTVAEVDGFFFAGGRKVCLETEPPRCDSCPIATRCAQQTDLFQPIIRTTAY